jgi:hypothetical protein
MISRSFSQSYLIVSLALAAGLLCSALSAYAATSHPVEIILLDTGKTVAIPVGQELVVSLPLLHYEDDYWYMASNSGGTMSLIAQPVEKRPRNFTPWGYSRQEFHFRRQSPGPAHLVFERSYWSKPMVLEVVDPQASR